MLASDQRGPEGARPSGNKGIRSHPLLPPAERAELPQATTDLLSVLVDSPDRDVADHQGPTTRDLRVWCFHMTRCFQCLLVDPHFIPS